MIKLETKKPIKLKPKEKRGPTYRAIKGVEKGTGLQCSISNKSLKPLWIHINADLEQWPTWNNPCFLGHFSSSSISPPAGFSSVKCPQPTLRSFHLCLPSFIHFSHFRKLSESSESTLAYIYQCTTFQKEALNSKLRLMYIWMKYIHTLMRTSYMNLQTSMWEDMTGRKFTTSVMLCHVYSGGNLFSLILFITY